MSLLDIERLHIAQGALRHGVLFDMLARDEKRDVRFDAVQGLARRFNVDLAQSARVKASALVLLNQLELETDLLARASRKLGWAAELHEIGNLVSPTDGHKHGAYIIDNAEVPGFTVDELHRLSLLVLGQRGKLKKLDADFSNQAFTHSLMCLRLAVIFCHARRDPKMAGLRLTHNASGYALQADSGWASEHPQSVHLLNAEAQAWDRTDIKLGLKL
jgi:exopolyphosphatase / guanosine-5'-triphosphate,3'-diphosphate pyrophosphatase